MRLRRGGLDGLDDVGDGFAYQRVSVGNEFADLGDQPRADVLIGPVDRHEGDHLGGDGAQVGNRRGALTDRLGECDRQARVFGAVVLREGLVLELLLLEQHPCRVPGDTGGHLRQLGEFAESGVRGERGADDRELFIAGGAVRSGAGVERFQRCQHCLGVDQPVGPQVLAQAIQIGAGIGDAVEVVDAHTVDEVLFDQVAQPSVGRLVHLRLVEPQRSQVGHVGETPVAVAATGMGQ